MRVPSPRRKAKAAELQILRMLRGDPVGHKGKPDFVVISMPSVAAIIAAQGKGVIDLGVSEGFVVSVVSIRREKKAAKRALPAARNWRRSRT